MVVLYFFYRGLPIQEENLRRAGWRSDSNLVGDVGGFIFFPLNGCESKLIKDRGDHRLKSIWVLTIQWLGYPIVTHTTWDNPQVSGIFCLSGFERVFSSSGSWQGWSAVFRGRGEAIFLDVKPRLFHWIPDAGAVSAWAATGDCWPLCRIQKKSAFVAFALKERRCGADWNGHWDWDKFWSSAQGAPGSTGERLRLWKTMVIRLSAVLVVLCIVGKPM